VAPLIRLVEEEDAAGVLAIYAPVVRETAISFELEPPSLEEMRGRIRSLETRLPWLVCSEGPSIWGYAYADRFRTRAAYQWSAEVTVYVSPSRQRRGVARALYSSLLAALRLLGYRNAFAGIAQPNPASVALHEALGFRPAGVFRAAGFKLGRWHDVGWWQLELAPLGRPDAPPQQVAALRASPGWRDALAGGLAQLHDPGSPS
jgi:phosphinothricin acetyltransferase